MKKTDAIGIVQNAFGGMFNEQSFQVFIANLLKNYEALDKVREGQYIREAFRQFISKYQIIGSFKDNEGNLVDILQVFLCKGTSLERARTAQRNFVADYLKNNLKVAALVAFIAPEEQDWRFSLVKMEYSLDVKEGKLKTSEEITPAKRWSFLVGLNEGSHTAQSRFVSLLESNESPNLKELEEAFNIEKVTNEFFQKYCDLFLRMKESLDRLLENDPQLKKDFESKEISTVDFAKKTLGQMAFLYFLQKKGWFGVAPSKEWGSGAKNFLRALFNARGKYGENFFDDVLEPLFYEALAVDRGKEAIYTRLNNCRMPFLNGGLFEPMNGYTWETTKIVLPDELFSNANKTKEGDIGDGILDIFDLYNFTVNENEPLEKEVAVDPEMLGKVFETLCGVTNDNYKEWAIAQKKKSAEFNKKFGVYYTPREIVHYMCQESLINYLHSEMNEALPREDLEVFIQKGIQIIQNDQIVLERGRETDTYKFILPESIRKSAGKLDMLLANIKICDPAVGSGAFPLGMLNEIVRARQVLGVHSGSKLSPYDLKLHTISHSIYGVDIDSGAVEIAKLRMWLALVVEEKDPHPLPNLEHKIMQGNSLISEYEGIKLFDDSFLADIGAIDKEKVEINEKLAVLQREYFDLHSKNQLDPVKKVQIESEIKQLQKRLNGFEKKGQLTDTSIIGLFDIPIKQKVAQEKTEKLQKKIEQFVSESRKTQKQDLKEEIDTLKWELIEATLEEEGRMDKLEEIRELRRKNIRPLFIWKLEFSEVFKEKGGFDVVIGNPPYGVSIKDGYRNTIMKELGKVPDFEIYYYFVELSKKLLKDNGVQSYIIPNTFLFNVFATEYRKSLIENWLIINLIDCTAFKIFDSATVHNAITVFIKTQKNDAKIGYKQTSGANSFIELIQRPTSHIEKENLLLNNTNWGLVFKLSIETLNLIRKVKKSPLKLKDVFDVSQGYIPYRRSDLIKKFGENEGNRIVDERAWHSNKKENDEYKEEIFGKSLSRYSYSNTGSYVKYGKHLACYVDPKFFNRKRILIREITNPHIIACYVEKEFVNDPQIINIINQGEEENLPILWAILNSKLATFYHFNASPKATKGAFPKILVTDIKEFPLPDWNKAQELSSLVERITQITSATDYDLTQPPLRQKELEAKIDEMVFDLYELTPEEREIVLKS